MSDGAAVGPPGREAPRLRRDCGEAGLVAPPPNELGYFRVMAPERQLDDCEEGLRDAASQHPILGPFVRLIEYRNDAARLVGLATIGIHGLIKFGRIAKSMRWRLENPRDAGELTESQIALIEGLASSSSSEIDNDFQLLRAHALVGLWGALEDFHDDLLIEWMRVKPSAMSESAAANVSVPIGEYLARDERGRAELVLSELKKTLRSDLQPGLGQFLPLLNELGLYGEVEADVKKALLEFQQTRHVWAHKAGRVDERFLLACPWRTDVSVGSRLHVDEARWTEYLDALSKYSATVLDWVDALGGEGLESSRRDLTGDSGTDLIT